MYTETRPLYMLSKRGLPQTQGHIQTESEGLEKDISCKWKIKQKQQYTRSEEHNNSQGDPIRITADLSTESLQAIREWQDIFKVMKEQNIQPRLLYPARISFKYKGEIKSFTDKQKLREFSTTKPALQQMLKDLLYTENTEKVYKLEPKTTK